MFDTHKISEISNKIREIIDSSPAADIEKNLNALLQGVFTKLELVSRAEFDVQREVLQRTRMQLEVLEQRLAELEAGRQQQD
ncbi:MAG: accessory factor UbiK family protein [Methylobacterium sp.]|nr:accessory factor UbiK family protein [Methylobacterium sp.]